MNINDVKVKIAFLESGADDNQTMPIYMGVDVEGEYECEHAEKVIKHFHRQLNYEIQKHGLPFTSTNFEIILLPKNKGGLQWCYDNDVEIISMSALDWDIVGGDLIRQKWVDKLEVPLMSKCLMICGAGNDGRNNQIEDRVESPASQRGWLSVGAVSSTLQPRNYSSYGLGEVDCVGIDGIDGDYGTSFSTPYCTAIFSIYCAMHKLKLGYTPSPISYFKFMVDNTHDIHTEGWDFKTGYGLLKLPTRWVFNDIVIKKGNQAANFYTYINDDPPIIKEFLLDVVPTIVNGRITLSATDLTKMFGASKYWDQENEEAHYSFV